MNRPAFHWGSAFRFTALAIVVASLAACSSASTEDESASTELAISTNIDNHFAASTVRNGIRFQVEGQAKSPTVHNSVVKVGNKTFDWVNDGDKGKFTVDGHGNTLTSAERAAMKLAYADVLKVWVKDPKVGPEKKLGYHQAMLLGELLWLQDHHDKAIHRYSRFTSEVKKLPDRKDVGYAYGTEGWEMCINHADGTWQPAYTMPWGGSYNYFDVEWAVVNGNGGANFSGYGINRGYNAEGDWTCQGQCGVGCQWGWRSGRFVDCFEHDVCTDFHPDSDCDQDKAFAAPAFAQSFWGDCQ